MLPSLQPIQIIPDPRYLPPILIFNKINNNAGKLSQINDFLPDGPMQSFLKLHKIHG